MKRRIILLLLAALLAPACSDDASVDQGARFDPNLDPVPGGGSNVNLGGAQDFGYFRRLLDDGQVPTPEAIDSAGFFAEHHTELPPASCGERVCAQAMIGTMNNLLNGNGCTLLQIALNSPITIDPENRPPLTLALVIDVSGSMNSAGKIGFVRTGLAQLINELRDTDRVAVVTYSDRARLVFEMDEVGLHRNELQALIRGLEASGSTNISDGLEVGYGEVLASYELERQNRVIMLSDGEPTAGILGVPALIELSRGYNSEGVGLTTIGLGTDFNLELMRGLAEQADGNFYFVENAAAIEEVFTEEVSYFTVPIAFDLELTVTAGEEYRFLASYGSSFFESTPEEGRLRVPSAFIAHRRSHDDMTPAGGRRGGGSSLLLELMPAHSRAETPSGGTNLAIVELTFREPGTNEIISSTRQLRVPFSPWEVPELGHFDNPTVEKSFVVLNIFAAIESACTLFHAGMGEQAITTVRTMIAAASDYEDSANGGMGDADIRADIELLGQLERVLIQNGTPPVETQPPADPWPRD
jgi:Ca-activated chloride channel family protein